MKFILLFSYLVMFVSCGASPLFSSLDTESLKEVPVTLGLSSARDIVWKGDDRLHFAISWKESPNVSKKSSFVIKFWDSYQNDFFGPYEKLNNPLCIFLWMKMPDGNEHGSSPVSVLESDDSYLIDDIYFIMSGVWELRLRTVEDISHCTSLKNSPFIHEEIIKLNVL